MTVPKQLTTGWLIYSGTNSPPKEMSTQSPPNISLKRCSVNHRPIVLSYSILLLLHTWIRLVWFHTYCDVCPPRLIWVRVLVFNATFNNISAISWWSALLVEETGVPGENQRPVASHWQTLSHNVASSTPRLSGFELTTLVVIGFYCIGSYKSNYHTITTTAAIDLYVFIIHDGCHV